MRQATDRLISKWRIGRAGSQYSAVTLLSLLAKPSRFRNLRGWLEPAEIRFQPQRTQRTQRKSTNGTGKAVTRRRGFGIKSNSSLDVAVNRSPCAQDPQLNAPY